MGILLAIVLVVIIFSVLPNGPVNHNYGYFPSGGLGIVLVIIIILVLMGRF
jgi:hypothetical protein